MMLLSPGDVLVDNEPMLGRLLDRLPHVPLSAIDIETNGGEAMHSRPVTLQLYWGDKAFMVTEPYLRRLKPWFDTKPTGIFYSAKGDLHGLANIGLPFQGPIHDALVVDYLCDENVKVSGVWESSLKQRHGELFQHPPRKTWKQAFGKQGADAIIASEGYTRLKPYGCADVRETWDVYHAQKKRLEKLEWSRGDTMFDHFTTYEAPYTRVLYDMERRGCLVDVEFLEELRVKAEAFLETKEAEFYRAAREVAGEAQLSTFTEKLLTSPQQLGKLFYDVIGYPEKFNFKRVEGRRVRVRTSDADALAELAADGHRLPVILDEFRRMDRIRNTNIVGLLDCQVSGRVHTDFIQAFTLTGRLSSRHPNLQNIPRPENDPFGIRQAFIPSPGMLLLSADYSQVEVRVAAHMSGDPGLIEACQSSDIYIAMAALLFPHEPDVKAVRQIVKAIILGILFGKQAASIAADLGITEARAEGFLSQFFKRFPRMSAFMNKQMRDCRNNGFVRTITGRYRRIPEIRSHLPYIRSHAERQSLNAPIQGSAFDIIEKAQLNIASSGVCEDYGGHMILVVHDEILFEFPKETVRVAKPKLVEMLEHPFEQDLLVPLAVSAGIGATWAEAK